LQGKLKSIRRFIVQLANKCFPFTHVFYKEITFKWDERCDQEFKKVKYYLSNPPIIMPPIHEKPMILYVSTTIVALGAFLVQKNEQNKERAIYYSICTLLGYELNYSPIERACLLVVFATQKLRNYMFNRRM
jgi:hypothetical protein